MKRIFILALLLQFNVYAKDKQCLGDAWEMSEACYDEQYNREHYIKYFPVVIAPDRSYKNWRAGLGFYNIPNDFKIIVWEADWPKREVRLYVLKNEKKVMKIAAIPWQDGSPEKYETKGKGGCHYYFSDLFTLDKKQEMISCSYTTDRQGKDSSKDIECFATVDPVVEDWFMKNFKVFEFPMPTEIIRHKLPVNRYPKMD